ncbi:MAG: CDP-diacylglycerol--serine O-phosphatidyltransferase [Gammaproteobacteria bacterium]
MVDDNAAPRKPRKGIYLLPNLFTTAALFAGFFAIISAIGGRYQEAAVSIFIAMIFDGLDGRIARLTNTASAFGVEYDSLSDMVSFGVAPALVVYVWALQEPMAIHGIWGKLGWLAAFLYAAMAALRLARFNTQVGTADKRYFQGLASPAAAGVIAGMVWVADDMGFAGQDLWFPAIVVTVIAGLLMVSNVRYHSGKNIDLKGRVPFFTVLIVVVLFVLTSVDPPKVLFGAFLAYAVSGPVLTLVQLRKRRAERQR